MSRRYLKFALALVLGGPLAAVEPDRDFSGKWIFDANSSTTRSIPAPLYRLLTIDQNDSAIQCSSTRPDNTAAEWKYALDGSATRYQVGSEKRNSEVKWEGSSLMVSTIVSGAHDYTEMDRWTLSRNRAVLTIERQIIQGGNESEGILIYRREGSPMGEKTPARAPAPVDRPVTKAPELVRPQQASAPAEIKVRAGTRIPLSLRNALDTRHSHEGDRVYLDTIFPIVVDNRVVIPRGSYVTGTLTHTKPAGAVKGKGELFIRFDTLILPNGVSRDFRSRLGSADAGSGKVDPKEGTITGERQGGQAKTTAEGAGIGAGVGGLAGAAAGHPLGGVGIGAAAGAAVGLATALSRHRADVTLPRGTTLEMVLDRDIFYSPSELAGR